MSKIQGVLNEGVKIGHLKHGRHLLNEGIILAELRGKLPTILNFNQCVWEGDVILNGLTQTFLVEFLPHLSI